MLRALEREHLDEPEQAVLGRDVPRLERRRHEPVRGRDCDEAAVTGRRKRLPGVLREQERARQQHREKVVPPLLREVRDRRDMLEARVRDDRVEPAEPLERSLDDGAVPLRCAQVCIRDVDAVDGPAGRLEPRDDGRSDPAGGAGDQRDARRFVRHWGLTGPQRTTVAAHV